MTTSEKVKQLLEAGCWVRMKDYENAEFTFIAYIENESHPFILDGDSWTDVEDSTILEVIPRKPKMYPVGTKVNWELGLYRIEEVIEPATQYGLRSVVYEGFDNKLVRVSHFDVIPVWEEEPTILTEGSAPMKAVEFNEDWSEVVSEGKEIEELGYEPVEPGSNIFVEDYKIDKLNEVIRALNTLIKQNHE